MIAEIICVNNLNRGDKPNKSSAKPITKKAIPPTVTPQISNSFSGGRILPLVSINPPNHQTIKSAIRLLIKIETPPKRTIGCLWILRPPGWSTSPIMRAIFLIVGVVKSTSKVEIIKVIKW